MSADREEGPAVGMTTVNGQIYFVSTQGFLFAKYEHAVAYSIREDSGVGGQCATMAVHKMWLAMGGAGALCGLFGCAKPQWPRR